MAGDYGTRPRSLDLTVEQEIEAATIVKWFAESDVGKDYYLELEAVFQIARKVFNITFKKIGEDHNSSVRSQLLLRTRSGIHTSTGIYRFSMPVPPATRVCIRGVPTEIGNHVVRKEIEKLGCGKVREIQYMKIRGTNIHNGFRSIWIEGYKAGSLPDQLQFDHVNCRLFNPAEEKVKKCAFCLNEGHIASQCKNEITCIYCKQSGHKQKECKKRREDFPPLRKNQDTEQMEYQKKPTSSNETNVPATSTRSDATGAKKKRPHKEISPDTTPENPQDTTKRNQTKKKMTETRVYTEQGDSEYSETSSNPFEDSILLPPGAKRPPPKATVITAQLNKDIGTHEEADTWIYGKKNEYVYILDEGENTDEYVIAVKQSDWDKGLTLQEAKRKIYKGTDGLRDIPRDRESSIEETRGDSTDEIMANTNEISSEKTTVSEQNRTQQTIGDNEDDVFEESTQIFIPPNAKREPPENINCTGQLLWDLSSRDSSDSWLTGKKGEYIYLYMNEQDDEHIMAVNVNHWETGIDITKAKKKLSYREGNVVELTYVD